MREGSQTSRLKLFSVCNRQFEKALKGAKQGSVLENSEDNGSEEETDSGWPQRACPPARGAGHVVNWRQGLLQMQRHQGVKSLECSTTIVSLGFNNEVGSGRLRI